MEAKKTLGRDIVDFYYGADVARSARAEWERRFSGKQDPTEIPEVDVPADSLTDGKLPGFKLLVALKLATSNNEARRHVQGGGVTIGEGRDKLTHPNVPLPVPHALIA